MATTTAGSGTVFRNNGGVILNIGSSPEYNIRDLSLIKNLPAVAAYGTTVVQDSATGPIGFTDPNGVTKVRSAGTFAYTPPYGSGYLFVAAGDINAGSINGSGSTILTIPGGAVGQVINKNLKTTQVGTYATAKFDLYAVPSSGVVPGRTKGTGAGTAVTYVSTSGNFPAIDDAASPTRAVPGELTYRFGAPLPTRNVAYKAKDSNE
jgi:hypothetical protein